jgi:hypothetical protein
MFGVVFAKKSRVLTIFVIYKIVFLKQIPWNGFTAAWTGSMGSAARGLQLSFNQGRSLADLRLRSI